MDLEESKCRMHNWKLYYAGQPELIADQLTYLEKNFDYNQLRPSQQKEKQALLKQLFAEIGESCYIFLLKPFEYKRVTDAVSGLCVTLNFQASNSLYTLTHEEATIHIESLVSATSDQDSSRNSAECWFLLRAID